MSGILNSAISQVLTGPLQAAAGAPAPFSVTVHRQFNPESKSSTNIVPALLGIILSMTMTMITAVAIVRESERGTMETLIATPVRPLEVMLGKILPYVLVGYVQIMVFLLFARVLFNVPFDGSVWAFVLGFNLFIIVNLALGFLISTLVRNQMQAMQLSIFTILPSILLSGFMFPFAAMPGWAQGIGSAVPATHFLQDRQEDHAQGRRPVRYLRRHGQSQHHHGGHRHAGPAEIPANARLTSHAGAHERRRLHPMRCSRL